VGVEQDPLGTTLGLIAERDVLKAVEPLDYEGRRRGRATAFWSGGCQKLGDCVVACRAL
jgi:hypothetical protein